jgi:hypothetical protein
VDCSPEDQLKETHGEDVGAVSRSEGRRWCQVHNNNYGRSLSRSRLKKKAPLSRLDRFLAVASIDQRKEECVIRRNNVWAMVDKPCGMEVLSCLEDAVLPV